MLIGIVTPAFNAAPWIGNTIRSVLAQSHADWTMMVVDDGSTDTTADVVQAFSDPRLRLIQQPNAGVSEARNRGIAALDTDALLFLDADDWLAPDALTRLADALHGSPAAIGAIGGFAFVSADGRLSRTHQPPAGDLFHRLLRRNRFANGGHLLLRSTAVHRAGAFHPSLAYGEDWEYWIRLSLLGRFAATTGKCPVLFVRQLTSGAYYRQAVDASAFDPCMDAIFANPDLLTRLGPVRVAAMRQRAEAENAWIVGRELLRHGRMAEGRVWLRQSFLAHPTLKRAALLAGAHALQHAPGSLRLW